MDTLEKVELVRQKCGASYEDAKAALDACNDDVLDAIIWLEKQGKVQGESASYTTGAAPAPDAASPEMAAAQAAYQESSKKSHFAEDMDAAWETVKKVLRKSVECKFVAKRHGETILNVPVLVPIIGIFVWGATIWLLIIGLFFGMRYHIDGANPVTVDVNDAMGKAADAAESLKKDVTKND